MRRILSALLTLSLICSCITVSANLEENFLFETDPDEIVNFSYSKMNIDPNAETRHIEWKGANDRDWMLVNDMDNFGYKTVDNVIKCGEKGKDSSVTYIDSSFGGKSLSVLAIYDNRIINEMADGDWAGWRLLYKNMPYHLYAGPSLENLSEIEPTHFKTAAWQEAVYVEYMVKQLPADTKVIRVVVPGWDDDKYSDRKIGRVTVSDNLNFVNAYVNPFRSLDADEAFSVKLMKVLSGNEVISSLKEGDISVTAAVAYGRSQAVSATLFASLYKKGRLVDIKADSKLMSSYETAILSTESTPFKIALGEGESISDYDLKMRIFTDVGLAGPSVSIGDTADKDVQINAGDYTDYKLAVVSPKYTNEILGDTKIQMVAPKMTKVEAKCWQQGDGAGSDSVVATVNLDSSGTGTFVFPADEYPHGPVTIRLTATEMIENDGELKERRRDITNLQLYNLGGVKFNEGLESAPIPEVAKNLKVFYQDDFDGPLSIARFDSSAQYGSHKVKFGDFSGVFFKDFEDENLSPFGQVGSYMRIRADQNKNSAGLFSTVHQDGTGVQTLPPSYFECKMIAPYAKGTWPAVWFMTNNQGKSSYTDELDLIEAYGFDDDTAAWSMNGYITSNHEWGREQSTNPDYSAGHTVNMRKLTGSSWFETFHTYGMYVGEEWTIYYIDNIEYHKHPTWPSSLTDPMYMLVNLAIGGSSGWPHDLSRYNGVVDMYVDWIRIFN